MASSQGRSMVSVIGLLVVIAGVVLVVAGVVTYGLVSSKPADQKITVSADAAHFGGQQVSQPWQAYAQADIIAKHADAIAGGKTYAELPQDDPVRETVMQASFLRASLFTSVVAYGVALFAAGMGVLAILFGWAIHRLAGVPVVVKRSGLSGA